jgi:hypothetical protein
VPHWQGLEEGRPYLPEVHIHSDASYKKQRKPSAIVHRRREERERRVKDKLLLPLIRMGLRYGRLVSVGLLDLPPADFYRRPGRSLAAWSWRK